MLLSEENLFLPSIQQCEPSALARNCLGITVVPVMVNRCHRGWAVTSQTKQVPFGNGWIYLLMFRQCWQGHMVCAHQTHKEDFSHLTVEEKMNRGWGKGRRFDNARSDQPEVNAWRRWRPYLR